MSELKCKIDRLFPRRICMRFVGMILVMTMVVGCGEAEETDDEPNDNEQEEFVLGGSFAMSSGDLDDWEIVLRNDVNDDELTLDQPDPFEFAEPLADGEDWHVVIDQGPDGWDCGLLEHSQGTIDGEDFDGVIVECVSHPDD